MDEIGKYEVILTNGDRAQADTVAAMLVCAWTLCQDTEQNETVFEVLVGGAASEWAWQTAIEHVVEKLALEGS